MPRKRDPLSHMRTSRKVIRLNRITVRCTMDYDIYITHSVELANAGIEMESRQLWFLVYQFCLNNVIDNS